jgi:autotransporter-associated beta strand protein
MVWGPVALSNTLLNVVQVDTGSLRHGSNYVILTSSPATPTTFQGLPEGARLVVNQNALTLSYQDGARFTLTPGMPFVWDGGGADGYWTTPANWVGDVSPVPFHTLTFPASAARRVNTNDFPPLTAFKALMFDGNSYNLRGSGLQLTNGIFHNVAGQNIVELGLRFSPSPATNPLPAYVATGLLRMDGSISNCSVRKTGAGVLRLGGSQNNPLFNMQVLDGTLELDKSSGAAAVTGTLELGDGATVATVSYLADDQLADTADVTVRRAARLELDGNTDAIDRLAGDGVISFGVGLLPAHLTVLGSGLFAGSIIGNGGFTKAGFGIMTLSGTNTFVRQTILEEGTLEIDGLHTNSTIALNGGILAGRGRLGVVQGTLGTLSPGRGLATFQNYLHTRNVQLSSNNIVQFTLFSLSPDFENNRLQVIGTVDLGGSVFRLRRFFNEPTNSAFILIENDGTDPIVGTFSGLPEGAITGADGRAFRVSYVGGTGNDLVVTRVTAPPSTFGSVERIGTNEVRLQGSGINGVNYELQSAFSLNPPIQWTPFAFPTASNGLWTINVNASVTQQFFRAISP